MTEGNVKDNLYLKKPYVFLASKICFFFKLLALKYGVFAQLFEALFPPRCVFVATQMISLQPPYMYSAKGQKYSACAVI